MVLVGGARGGIYIKVSRGLFGMGVWKHTQGSNPSPSANQNLLEDEQPKVGCRAETRGAEYRTGVRSPHPLPLSCNRNFVGIEW